MQREKSTFFAYAWHIDPIEINQTIIRIYGLGENDENICVKVQDFEPYAFIQLPEEINWNYAKVKKLISRLNAILKDNKPVTYDFQMKKRLYYASLDEKGERKLFPYLKCMCNCVEDIKQISYKVRRPLQIQGLGNLNLKLHEHNANPILQLTSQRLLPTAGWIAFSGRRVPEGDKETFCVKEYEVSWQSLSPSDNNTVARPLLMGFDLEVNSSVPSSMPKAERPPDKVFQISCVFSRQGSMETTEEKILLTLGETNEIEDVEVRMFETESDLLLGFTELLQEKQPNVCMGYNIFGFDIPYMIERAKWSYILPEFDQQGMLKDRHAIEKSIKWSSSAYKNQSFQFLDVEGRIFVDLLPLVKRDLRLAKYDLKTVAATVLEGITKDPLDAKGIFKCYAEGMKGGERGKRALSLCGRYCVKDSELVNLLFEKRTTWIALCEMSKVTGVSIFSLTTQGQQIKVFSQVYKKATHENVVVEKDGYIVKEDDYYVGATVIPPTPGVYDNVIPFDFCLTGDTLISMADGTSKRLDRIGEGDLVLGYKNGELLPFPSGELQFKGGKPTIKVSLEDGTNITCTPDHKFMLENEEWCEAILLEGKKVKCIDGDFLVLSLTNGGFRLVYDIEVEDAHSFVANGCIVHNCSLYPSAIMAYNLCWSTLVTDSSIPDEKCHVLTWHDDIGCEHDPIIIRKTKVIAEIKEREVELKELRRQRDLKENRNCKELFKEKIAKIIKNTKPLRDERTILNKSKPKHIICAQRNFRWLKEPKGVLPELLTHLIDTRSATKKEMKKTEAILKGMSESDEKYHDLESLKDVLDQRQLALKTSANSVTPETPIPCRIDGVFCYRTIEELASGDWENHNTGEVSAPISGLEVWSDVGFTKVLHVFRHIPNTKINRINTHTGIVDCTEHHSLLSEDGKEVRPVDLEVGDKLLHKSVPLPVDTPKKPMFKNITNKIIEDYPLETISEKQAFGWGMFFAEGTCGEWGTTGAIKRTWIIYNKDLALLERTKELLEETEPDSKFKISNYFESAGVYHLLHLGKQGQFIAKYRKLFYSDRKLKKIPDEIINASFKVRQAFLMGYYAGDGHRTLKTRVLISNKGYIGTAQLYYLVKSLGYQKVSVSNYKDNIFTLQCSEKFRIVKETAVKKISQDVYVEEKRKLRQPVVLMEEEIKFNEGVSSYRNIKINCQKIPGSRTIASLDSIIDVALLRNSYVTEYTTSGKKVTYKKYCCGKETSMILGNLRVAIPENEKCACLPVPIVYDKNARNPYIESPEKPYVYDIETENHHFAAGVGDIIVHNSAYGITGARKGYLTFFPVAMSTTYVGRLSIEKAAKNIQEKYKGKLVYGDTDSNYVSFPHLKTTQNIWDHAINVAKQVSALFPPPMSLAFEEKLYKRFMILTKKRYMSLACDREGKFKMNKETNRPEISKKGVLLTRRDNCPFVRKVYEDVIMAIFDKKKVEDILYYIVTEINKLCSGFYPASFFIITKSIGDVGELEPVISEDEKGKTVYKIGDYKLRKILPSNPVEAKKELEKSDCASPEEYYLHMLPAQAQLSEKMRERGRLVAAGSRIEYIITTTGGHTAKQYLKIEDSDYFLKHSNSIKIDYLFYLKQLMNPLDQVLDIIYYNNTPECTYVKGFVQRQYKFRMKNREAVLNQLRDYFNPKFIIIEDVPPKKKVFKK